MSALVASLPKAGDQMLITPDDLRPVIGIVTIVCLLLNLHAVAGRFVLNCVRSWSSSRPDEGSIILSTIFAVAQAAAILVAVSNGLGSVSPENQGAMKKAFYAATFLFLAALFFSKLSVALFVRALAPNVCNRRFGLVALIVISALGIAAPFGAAFQCRLSTLWSSDSEVCYNMAFWDTLGIIAAIIDTILCIWPLVIMHRLQIPLRRKVLAIGCFACRISSVGAAITLVVIQQQVRGGKHTAFDLWKVAVCMQAMLSASLVSACVPHLVTFLGSLVSGMLRADDIRRQYGSFSRYFARLTGVDKEEESDTTHVYLGQRPDNQAASLADVASHANLVPARDKGPDEDGNTGPAVVQCVAADVDDMQEMRELEGSRRGS